ncbi:MAG: hypothetical protein ABL864_14025 [Terricaulis sp.]
MAAAKYLRNNAGTITETSANDSSAGAGDAGKIVALDASGKLDTSLMPTGIGADTAVITASENLAAGDLVNVHSSTGAKVRKADASTSGKTAHGFVLSAVTSGNPATVYFEGSNTQVTGLTPGVQYLSASTAGLATLTAPSGTGQVVQIVGIATDAAVLNFQSGTPIVLA